LNKVQLGGRPKAAFEAGEAGVLKQAVVHVWAVIFLESVRIRTVSIFRKRSDPNGFYFNILTGFSPPPFILQIARTV
jgi:hypothetical protein